MLQTRTYVASISWILSAKNKHISCQYILDIMNTKKSKQKSLIFVILLVHVILIWLSCRLVEMDLLDISTAWTQHTPSSGVNFNLSMNRRGGGKGWIWCKMKRCNMSLWHFHKCTQLKNHYWSDINILCISRDEEMRMTAVVVVAARG